jgi:hypothetical protein
MSSIDELLEVIRCSETGRNAEEIGAMIAKGSIVGMLNNSHNLDNFIP